MHKVDQRACCLWLGHVHGHLQAWERGGGSLEHNANDFTAISLLTAYQLLIFFITSNHISFLITSIRYQHSVLTLPLHTIHPFRLLHLPNFQQGIAEWSSDK